MKMCKRSTVQFILFFVAFGLRYACNRNAAFFKFDSLTAVAQSQILSAAKLDDDFFALGMKINGFMFIGLFMLSVKIPQNKCLSKLVVYSFVTIRVLLFFFLFYLIMSLYVLMFRASLFVLNEDMTKSEHGNKFNLVVADIIVGLCFIVVILHIIAVLSIPCIIQRQISQNGQRSFCSQFKSMFQGAGNFIWHLIKNFIYPEQINTDLLDGLYNRETEKERMNTLYDRSAHHSKQCKLENYISTHKKLLNTFLELTCPVCQEELNDGAEVVHLECSGKHVYHSDCLQQYWMAEQDAKLGYEKEYACADCGEQILIDDNFNPSIYVSSTNQNSGVLQPSQIESESMIISVCDNILNNQQTK